MMPQPGMKNYNLILPNISRSKGNQTMTLGQLIKYNKGNIYLQKSNRKCGREISSRTLLFFKKALHEVKASGLHLSFNLFGHKIKQSV